MIQGGHIDDGMRHFQGGVSDGIKIKVVDQRSTGNVDGKLGPADRVRGTGNLKILIIVIAAGHEKDILDSGFDA
jgi:hypothetical protein